MQFKNWWILGGEEVVAAYESTGRSFTAASAIVAFSGWSVRFLGK